MWNLAYSLTGLEGNVKHKTGFDLSLVLTTTYFVQCDPAFQDMPRIGTAEECNSLKPNSDLVLPILDSMLDPPPLHMDERTLALFACLHYMFLNGLGTHSRKRQWWEDMELHMDDDFVTAALALMESRSATNSSESEGVCYPDAIPLGNVRSLGVKPRGGDWQVRSWVTDPFWFEDPDFKRNLRVSHATFLRIVSIVSDSVKDSAIRSQVLCERRQSSKLQLDCITLGTEGLGGPRRMSAALDCQQLRAM
jgi:hypothetical protein